MNLVLIGAGGHAKAVCEAIAASDNVLCAYADPRPAAWLDIEHFDDESETDKLDPATGVVIGIGGVTTEALEARLRILDHFIEAGRPTPAIVHQAACVSPSAELGPGVIILAGAVVQPAAKLGRGAIVNTRAVVEHDSAIGAGSHIAPGAMVLGGCRVGDRAMVGAGAVVLPGSEVPDASLVPALKRYPQ